jgi:hypothetical protein
MRKYFRIYSWRTLLSWALVDRRNLACHHLWAAHEWERHC